MLWAVENSGVGGGSNRGVGGERGKMTKGADRTVKVFFVLRTLLFQFYFCHKM